MEELGGTPLEIIDLLKEEFPISFHPPWLSAFKHGDDNDQHCQQGERRAGRTEHGEKVWCYDDGQILTPGHCDVSSPSGHNYGTNSFHSPR